jgi:protoheme IX farnesyltransferase
VIGGLAGALPPAIGWAAVTGNLSLAPLVLVAIIFMWTPPHFWALSLWRCGDYAKAGIPMLPVVRGKTVTRRHILAYSLILAPLGVVPAFIGLGGMLYLVTSASMGFWMLLEAFATWRERDEVKEPAAKRLFGVSLLYIFVPFAALIVERLLHLPPLWA